MFPSITWQSTLISFDHEIHCRDTRLTQLRLGVVHDSCDFPVVVVVVGVYFWAMITHLISRNSFRVPLCFLVCVCVCVREKLAVRWPGGCQSALLSAAATAPFSFHRIATDAAHAGPTYCTGFCPIAWQMTPPQVSLPVPGRVRRLQLRLRFGFRFLARAGPGWGHLVFKRLSTRPVQRVQSRVLLCFVLLLSSSCSFSSISATHSLLGAFSCRLRLRSLASPTSANLPFENCLPSWSPS